MLFEKLLDGITTIIEFLARVILFLLKVLGLWIPALYSLLFVLLCAVFKINFTEVLAIYLVGLALSVILTFYLMVLKVVRRKKRRFMEKQEKRARGKIRKNENISEDEENADVKTAEKVETKQETTTLQQSEQPNANAVTATENTDGQMLSYPPLQTNPTPPQYVSPSSEDLPFTSSKPKIFRTRMDPNLLIYEYSDRLVFYRKTLNGLEHVKTERKNANR